MILDMTTMAVLGVAVLIVLLVMGMNIGVAMMAVGFFGVWAVQGFAPAFDLFKGIPFERADLHSLAVIPLFVLMGQCTYYSGLSAMLFDLTEKWLGGFKGGLAMATVAACALFAAICGSTAVTAATMGVLALPEMRKMDYADSLTCGSIAAGGTLGILIPPSTGFIIYGIVADQPIGALFAAGIVPGIVLALCYILSIAVQVKLKPQLAPGRMHFTMRERLASIKGCIGLLALFVIVLGGMFSGLLTVNKAAALGALASVICMAVMRKFTLPVFGACLRETLRTTGMVLCMLIGAYVFGAFLTLTQFPQTLAGVITGLGVSRYVILVLLILIYMALGCVVDALAMVVLTVPLLLPVMTALGFDPIWYGVLMVMIMEMGLITPPVGMNVYTVAAVAKDVPLVSIFKGVMPMVLGMLAAVFLVCLFPQLSLWLPGVVRLAA